MTEADEPRGNSRNGDRSVLMAGIALAAIASLAVAAVVVLGSRNATPLAEGSPDEAIQRYLSAFEDRDYATAYGWFSSAVQDELTLSEYERSVREYPIFDQPSRRVLTDRSTVDGDRAVVVLIIQDFYDGNGPFGGGEIQRSTREIRLVRESGAWRIADPLIWLEPLPARAFEP